MNTTNDECGGIVVDRVASSVKPLHGDNAPTFKRDGVTCWKCSNCDRVHSFGVYVFAHWDDDLQHTCDCGHQHSVLRGSVTYCGPARAPR